jgi:hypothetical protein
MRLNIRRFMATLCAFGTVLSLVLYLKTFGGLTIETGWRPLVFLGLGLFIITLPTTAERLRWFDWRYNWSGWTEGMPDWVRSCYYTLFAVTLAHFAFILFQFDANRPEFQYWVYVRDEIGGVRKVLNDAGVLAIGRAFLRYGALILIINCFRGMVSWWFPPNTADRMI